MKPRTAVLLLLVGFLAAVLGWYGGIATNRGGMTPASTPTLAFPGLAAHMGAAQHIEIANHKQTLRLVRDGDRWLLADHGDFPAIAPRAHALLAGLAELKLIEKRTDDPSDFDRLGVADITAAKADSRLVRVLDAKGAPLAALLLGHVRPNPQEGGAPQLFVRRAGENQVWLAEGSLDADPDLSGWIDHQIVNISRAEVESIAIDRPTSHLLLTRQGDKLVVSEPQTHPVLDQMKIDSLGHGLEYLSFSDIRSAKAIPGEKAGAVAFTTTTGLTLSATIYIEGETVWAIFSAIGKDKAAAEAKALEAKFTGFALAVPSWQTKTLLPTLDDLLPPTKPTPPPAEIAAPPTPALPPPSGAAAVSQPASPAPR